MSQLSLYLFGPPRVALDGTPLHIARRKATALLAYLAVSGQSHSRDWLATLLWPESDQSRARGNLRRMLSEIKGTLGESWLEIEREQARLKGQADLSKDKSIWLDVAVFQENLKVGETHNHPGTALCPDCLPFLEAAVALYQDDFMAGFSLKECQAYDEWQFFQAEELRGQLTHALVRLSGHSAAAQDYDSAIGYVRRWLALDPLHEPAHQQLMALYDQAGQRSAALRQYQICQQTLADELEAPPSQATTDLYERIRTKDLSSASHPDKFLTATPAHPPTGTVTFLFTDIQGSTPLWENQPEKMAAALEIHNAALHQAIEAHGGTVFKTVGDSFQAAFPTAPQALAAAIQGQRALQEAPWNELGELEVRMGLHTGKADLAPDGDEYAVSHTKNRVARIMSAAHGGQVLVSLVTAELLRGHLPEDVYLEDLGEHQLKGLRHPEQLYQVMAPSLPQQSFPQLQTGATQAEPQQERSAIEAQDAKTEQLADIPYLLPVQSTPFIGREKELAELDQLIADSDTRLLTIIGPGGMGKTRLAIACAESQLAAGHFPDGVFFVPLAPLDDPAHMVPAIATSMAITLDAGGDPKDQLLDILWPQHALLIMDNCEHLLGGIELFADILQAAPELHILATSRERLLLHGEQVSAINGLTYPDENETTFDPEAITGYTAVQFFLECARRVQPSFSPQADEIPILSRICRMVGGMPLAVELAAAWVELLSLADIAAEIQGSLDFLETELRNVPERHRSLRAVFESTWQQLSPEEAAIFQQLSVFRGGFTRQAAQEVTGVTLRQLGRLIFKSLLQYDQEGERYQMHELLHQYGEGKLSEGRMQEQAVRNRHSAYYCAFLQERESALKSAGVLSALGEIDAEIDNVRRAWDWAVAQGLITHLDQAVESLAWFYFWPARHKEANAAFQQAVQKLERIINEAPNLTGQENIILARLYSWQTVLVSELGNSSEAQRLGQRALEILAQPAPEKGNWDTRPEKAFALLKIGDVADRLKTKISLMEQSLDLYRALDDTWGMVQALSLLGKHSSGRAEEFYREALKLVQALGHPLQSVWIWMELGSVIASQGRFVEAEEWLRRALDASLEIDYRPGIIGSLNYAADVAILQGRFSEADELSFESMKQNPGQRMGGMLTWVKRNQNWVRLHQGQYDVVHEGASAELVEHQQNNNVLFRGFYQYLLGCAKLGQGETRAAQEKLLVSLGILTEINFEDEFKSQIQSVLCFTAQRSSDGILPEFQQFLEPSLGYCLETRNLKAVLWAIPAAAFLFLVAGERGKAVELYALASSQPFVANSKWFADVVGNKIEAIAATLPDEQVAGTRASGRKKDLWQTVESLLEELTELDGKRSGSSQPVIHHNLPVQLTSFIGRQREIKEVTSLVNQHRLVTLTGSGGVGKTRLSIRVAEELIDRFSDGVWFVELAPLANPSLVLQTVALTVGLQERSGLPFRDVLMEFLRSRQALIVLDNCEHLLEACAGLADRLLRGCPQLKLLASSREGLGITGEHIFRVPSLDLPGIEELGLEQLQDHDGVRLFVTRARDVLPAFQVTTDNAPSVVRICRRLDGIPLAMEMAAARLNMLTTEQLASRLDNAFRLLTVGSRTALPRHRTLRAVVDWSYQLLDEGERILLRRLSVFAGGWTLDGAELVCAGEGIEDLEIFDLLASLVDKSIVSVEREQGSETRYRLLEIVRQYAREKLHDAGESKNLRDRHLAYFATLTDQAYPHIHGAGRLEWTRKLKQEYDNLREALDWAFKDSALAHLGLAIAVNISDRFWLTLGMSQEGVAWLRTGLQAGGEGVSEVLQARANYHICRLVWNTDEWEQCIGQLRAVSPQAQGELALALSISAVDFRRPNPAQLEEAERIARKLVAADSWFLSELLFVKTFMHFINFQIVSEEEAFANAQEFVELSQSGDRWNCMGYWYLGIFQTRRGLKGQARQSLQQALDLSIEVDDSVGIHFSLFFLAWHYRLAGQTDRALRYCREMALVLMPGGEVDYLWILGMVLGSYLGEVDRVEENQIQQEGLRLLALWDQIKVDSTWHLILQKEYEQVLEGLQVRLGEDTYQTVWEEGQAMTKEAGMALANSVLKKYISQDQV